MRRRTRALYHDHPRVRVASDLRESAAGRRGAGRSAPWSACRLATCAWIPRNLRDISLCMRSTRNTARQRTTPQDRLSGPGHESAAFPDQNPTIRVGLLHHPHAWAVGILIAASIATTWMAVKSPSRVGVVEDDGVYLVTAKALSTGRGYVHLSLPGEPKQTKYPVLYPAIIAVFWKLCGSLDAVVLCAQLFNAAAAFGTLWLTYRLLCDARFMPPVLCAASVVVVAFNPDWWSFSELVMSEHLYAFFAALSLLLAVRSLERRVEGATVRDLGGDAPPRATGALARGCRVMPLCLTVSAAILTRSIGMSLCASVIAVALHRRRWLETLCIVTTVGICLTPWLVWRSVAATSNAAIPQASAFVYDLAYQSWLPSSVGQLARVIFLNLSRLGLGIVQVGASPAAWLSPSELQDESGGAILFLLALVMVALLLLGCFVSWRSGTRSIPFYLAAYLGLVLCWPFDPSRFVVPLLPVIIPMMVLGAYTVLRAVHARVAGLATARSGHASKRRKNARGDLAIPNTHTLEWIPVLVLLPILAQVICVLGYGWTQMRSPEKLRMITARQAMIDVLRNETPPDAVVAAPNAGYVYLVTGRKCVPNVPSGSSYQLYYAPDATFLQAGRFVTDGGAAFQRQMLERELVPYYERAGVTHVVDITGGGGYAIQRQAMDQSPNRFPLITRTSGFQLRAFQ